MNATASIHRLRGRRIFLSSLVALSFHAVPARTVERIFGDTTDVVAVEVPVQVMKDGKPVRGLTAADFEIVQDREVQELTGFEAIDLGTAQPGTVPVAGRRHFLLLFDLSFSEPKSIVKARAAAQEVVLKSLHPSDLVAVATYSEARGPELALGFTADRRQIEAAIDSLGLPALVDRNPDPLRLVAEQLRADLTSPLRPVRGASEEAAQRRRDLEQQVFDDLQKVAQAGDRSDQGRRRAGISAFARAFEDLARRLGGVAGRKYVVYLSEGFDASLLTGTTDKAKIGDMDDATLRGETWKVDSDERFGGRGNRELDKMLEELRRADCVIQAVDIGGVRASADLSTPRPSGEDALFLLADGTGGELYRSYNDLGEAMGRMLDRTGVTYLLSFQPTVGRDGAYHPIEVRLKRAPRGTKVIHRPGYYAPVPPSREDPLTRTMRLADAITNGEQGGDFAAAVLAIPLAGEAGRSYVPVLVEIGGYDLLAGHEASIVPAEIYAYALDAGGEIRDFFAQSLSLDVSQTGSTLAKGGLKFFGHLDLPVGEYSLRVMARNAVTGRYSLRISSLSIPDFGGGGQRLAAPLFPEAPGRSLLVREAPRGEATQPPYPFLFKGKPFVPSTGPALGAGGQAVVAFLGYGTGEVELKLETEVLDGSGKPLAQSEIELAERASGDSGEPEWLFATFRAPNLAPGDYWLRIRWAGGPEDSPAQGVSGASRFVIR